MDKLKTVLLFVLLMLSTSITNIEIINDNVQEEKNCDIDKLIQAIIWAESTDGLNTYNAKTNAVGDMQILPILIRDVNRIIGEKRYQHMDAYDRDKAIEMFIIYQEYYNKEWDIEKAARIWYGGPTGHRKSSTIYYWTDRVKPMYEVLLLEDC